MSGPYVQIAAFCDRALQEADGVLSLIRVIDRITVVNVQPSASPEIAPEQRVETTLVVALKADKARGRHTVSVGAEKPDGSRLPTRSIDVTFEGEDRGVNMVIPVTMDNLIEGLYWFEVKVGDQLLSRIPLRIMYLRTPAMQ